MMTVITETSVQPGQESAWDQAFKTRSEDARQQSGWVATQLLNCVLLWANAGDARFSLVA